MYGLDIPTWQRLYRTKNTNDPPTALRTLNRIKIITTLKFGQILGLKFFPIFEFLAELGEFGLIIDGELFDEELLVGNFMLQIGQVMFGHFLDHVVVSERFPCLEYGRMVCSH